MDGLRASAGRIGNQVFFFFFDVVVSGVVVSSSVEWRGVDDVCGRFAELHLICPNDDWKEDTAAGISSRIEIKVSLLHIATGVFVVLPAEERS